MKQSIFKGKLRHGATLQAYGLMVGLVAVVALVAITGIGESSKRLMTNVASTMENAGSGAASPQPSVSATPEGTVTASFWRIEATAPYTPSGSSCTVLVEVYLLDENEDLISLTGQVVDQGGGDYINQNPDEEISGSCGVSPCSTTATGLCSNIYGPDSAAFDGATPIYAGSGQNATLFSRNQFDFSFETTAPITASGIAIMGQQVSIGSTGMTNIPPGLKLYHGASLTGPWTQIGAHTIYSPANEGAAYSGGIQTAVSGLPEWPLVSAGPGKFLFNQLP